MLRQSTSAGRRGTGSGLGTHGPGGRFADMVRPVHDVPQESPRAIDDTAVEHLIALGRQRGRLTADDLRQLLPIETMTTNDIARIVGRLEDAGVAVDIDEALSARHSSPHAITGRGFESTPRPDPPEPSRSSAGAYVTGPAQVPPESPNSAPPRPVQSWGVLLLWIAVALAVFFVVLLFVFGLPGFR